MEKESSGKKVLHVEIDLQNASTAEIKEALKEIIEFESSLRHAIYLESYRKR